MINSTRGLDDFPTSIRATFCLTALGNNANIDSPNAPPAGRNLLIIKVFQEFPNPSIPVMIFDIDEIPEDGLDFAVEEKRGGFEIDQPDCFLVRDVRVQGRLNTICGIAYLSGYVTTELSVICSRCLETVSFPVNSEVTARFAPRGGAPKLGAETEFHADDVDTVFFDENKIDLKQPVHDLILLSVPLNCLCRKDCKGLCPECGKNLNTGRCGCLAKPPMDPRLEVLKSLKDKLK